jgi:Lamin Tail Domain
MFLGGWVAAGVSACAPTVPSVNASAPTPDAGAPDPQPVIDAAPQVPVRRDAAASADAGEAAAAPDAAHADVAGDRPSAPAARDAAPDAAPDDTAREAPSDVPDSARDGAGARAPLAGELRIDELLVDPAGDDLGHEWLEVVNLAAVPVDLAGLHVSDGTTDAAVDAGVLGPGALLVLGQSLDRAHNGDAPVARAYGTKLVLNNGADRIAVCEGPCSSGVTLDAVAWTTSWGAAYVGHAVVIDPKTGAACPATTPYGADGNYGSPGAPNPPCASGG